MKPSKHSFSVETANKNNITRISLDDTSKGVLIEGELGNQIQIEMIEGILLQLKGEKGVIRIDLTEDDVSTWLNKQKPQI